jgi:large subunit ribosomal protein L7/L12
MFKVLLIVILVLIALVMLRMMFLRRTRGRELFVTEATGRSRPRAELTKPAGGVDASPLEFEVIRLLEQQKKIQAIKLVREHTRLGLKEAKDLVEEVERTGRLRLPPLPTAPYVGNDELMDQARQLKRDGKAIEAIKLIRRYTRMGLKEAKDVYDSL